MSTSTLSKRQPRPCSLRVIVTATDEHGYAFVQWSDGTYSVKLDSGVWTHDVPAAQLVFVRSEVAA